MEVIESFRYRTRSVDGRPQFGLLDGYLNESNISRIVFDDQ